MAADYVATLTPEGGVEARDVRSTTGLRININSEL